MKSADEWLEQYKISPLFGQYLKQIISDAQSDAFHAGKLEGLNEAREIVKGKIEPVYDDQWVNPKSVI